jgi:hypothetical protein
VSAPIIKVALTGTHGVGKTFIVDNVAALAMTEGWEAQIVYSPTRHVKALGKDYGMANNKDGDWHFQWHVMSLTQLRAWEAEASAKMWRESEPHNTKPMLIIGDRCTWDPAAYTIDLINRIRLTSDSTPEEWDRRGRLERVYSMGMIQAREDTFWDQVFFKPHHPDHLDADPDRLDDRQYQLDVEECFRDLLTPRIVSGDIQELSIDRNDAVDELWSWIQNEAQARMVTR